MSTQAANADKWPWTTKYRYLRPLPVIIGGLLVGMNTAWAGHGTGKLCRVVHDQNNQPVFHHRCSDPSSPCSAQCLHLPLQSYAPAPVNSDTTEPGAVALDMPGNQSQMPEALQAWIDQHLPDAEPEKTVPTDVFISLLPDKLYQKGRHQGDQPEPASLLQSLNNVSRPGWQQKVKQAVITSGHTSDSLVAYLNALLQQNQVSESFNTLHLLGKVADIRMTAERENKIIKIHGNKPDGNKLVTFEFTERGKFQGVQFHDPSDGTDRKWVMKLPGHPHMPRVQTCKQWAVQVTKGVAVAGAVVGLAAFGLGAADKSFNFMHVGANGDTAMMAGGGVVTALGTALSTGLHYLMGSGEDDRHTAHFDSVLQSLLPPPKPFHL